MIETAYLLGIVAALLIVNSVALRWGGKFAFGHQPNGLAVVVLGLAVACVSGLAAWIGKRLNLPAYLVLITSVLVGAAACFASLAGVLRLSQVQALKGMLLLAVSSLCVLGFAGMMLPALVAGYSVPTNGMAPTIQGRHFLGKCPECGADAVVSIQENWETRRPEPADRSICTQCFRSGECAEVDPTLWMGDRILVRKLAQPRRWDIVVFQFPDDRRQIYVQRLVGLPGETIEIKAGAIWIDGVQLAPPAEIARLNRELPTDALPQPQFASGQPLRLGPEECFTLGDNPQNSYDSRYWGPLPVADLRGVAWKVYFPPRAWRSLPRH